MGSIVDDEPELIDERSARQDTPIVVEMNGARKEFDGVVAVESIDLIIAQGEIVGIIGPSGSGKTTMIRLLLGYYKPTAGDATVLGTDPANFSRSDRERIGYLPQQFLLYPELTVRENLEFAAGSYGLGWRARRRRLRELLAIVNLEDAENRQAKDISGGMQRRLALACALVHEPSLLVLDEPTAGIDPVLRARIWEFFRSLQAEGRTLVVTTQYVTESEYCDRVVLIDSGRVIAVGTPDELRRQAFGGEVVRVTVSDLNRELAAEILELRFVRSGTREGDDGLRLVVDDAGESIPVILEYLQARGQTVTTLEEYRESFDHVFVTLVESRGGSHETHP